MKCGILFVVNEVYRRIFFESNKNREKMSKEQLSIQNLSDIVKNKQKELNDMHDIQLNQLEQV